MFQHRSGARSRHPEEDSATGRRALRSSLIGATFEELRDRTGLESEAQAVKAVRAALELMPEVARRLKE